MKNQNGKITLIGIIMMLVIVYGVFAAIKLLSAGFMESQIENEIKQALYIRQGSDFTTTIGEEAILKILEKNDVFFDEQDEGAVVVTIDSKNFEVKYYVEFEIDIDLLFFKKTKEVTIDEVLTR